MKILFVVCGEGLGHASRSSKLAKYLKRCGHICYFATYGKAYEFIEKQCDFPLFNTCREVTLEGNGGYFNLGKTISSSIGITLSLLRSFFDIRKILKENSIHLLITDTMFAAGIAAKTLGIPVVFITNQNRFSSLAYPDAFYWKLFSWIISRYLVTIPNIILVPDFSSPNTVSNYNFKIETQHKHKFQFIGPILDPEIVSLVLTRETIFASFGGEPFKLPLYEMLKEIADTKPDLFFEVFSTSEGLPDDTENFKKYGYAPSLFKHMAEAKVLIVHGGLTSLHESLFFNKPLIMIIDPYHPEQGNNGRAIEEMGAGIMIRGDQITKESLNSAIDKALLMQPVSISHLFKAENGRENARVAIEDIAKKYGLK